MIISGHPIVFGRPSVDLGGFIEIIAPGAVDRTLRDDSDVVALVNHDTSKPLGRRSARTVQIGKSARGLSCAIDADDTISFVKDVLRVIERHDASGGSFGFRVIEDVWSVRDGKPFREIIDMTIHEISVGVTFPAYQQTDLHVSEPASRSRRRA